MWPVALAVAAVLFAGGALAQTAKGAKHKHKDVKQQVEQMEQTWRTAQLAGDVAQMDKLLSDDYLGITMTGQVVTKMQQLDRMRNRSLVLTKIDLDDLKVKLIGTTAIVTSLASIEGTNDGQNMHGVYRYTRVYTRSPAGVWKITNFEATRVGTSSNSGRHHPPQEGAPQGPSGAPTATPVPPGSTPPPSGPTS